MKIAAIGRVSVCLLATPNALWGQSFAGSSPALECQRLETLEVGADFTSTTFSGRLTANAAHCLDVTIDSAAAGMEIAAHMSARSDEVDPYLKLFDISDLGQPGAQLDTLEVPLITNDDAIGLDALLVGRLPAGVYRLEMRSYEATDAGPFEVLIWDNSEPAPEVANPFRPQVDERLRYVARGGGVCEPVPPTNTHPPRDPLHPSHEPPRVHRRPFDLSPAGSD